ncbi:MAG: Eco57I restriction-modification methylase domain-containing protein [Candidatus Odinarchaeota archaeon]
MPRKTSVTISKSGKLPTLGQVIHVRNRKAITRDIQSIENKLTGEQQHLLSVEYYDRWLFPPEDRLLWERETNTILTDSHEIINTNRELSDSFNTSINIEETEKYTNITGDELIIVLTDQIHRAIESLFNFFSTTITTQQSLNAESLSTSLDKKTSDLLRHYCTRFVFSLVFILFSEDKGILHPNSPIFQKSYSINSLYLYLENAVQSGGKEKLKMYKYAWSRLLALFKLLSLGSCFQQLSVTPHGEILLIFNGGIRNNLASRELDFLEEESCWPNDWFIYQILELLRRLNSGVRGKVEIKYSFSELTPEHMGLFYEGICEKQFNQKRKGEGIFYTKPRLAVSTVERTHEKLVFYNDGRKIKNPDQILDLKILDPSMGGSAIFLFATLRYLTDFLSKSIAVHGLEGVIASYLSSNWNRDVTGKYVKRLIAENCLYGVDIDPLAVELAKASMWVETGDESIQFTFLDQKFKTGNAILGCWSSQLSTYPRDAWNRDCGDKNHQSSVNYKQGHYTKLLQTAKKRIQLATSQKSSRSREDEKSGSNTVTAKYQTFFRLTTEFKRLFKEENSNKQVEQQVGEIKTSKTFKKLITAYDSWCSIWFWPIDDIDNIPLPDNYLTPQKSSLMTINELKKQQKFFHWELEYPEIFSNETRKETGFDAIVGNPPWETVKPQSKEFFEFYDPFYRSYGKQRALKRQKELFLENPHVEQEWLQYQASMKAFVNFIRKAGKYASYSPQENNLSNGESEDRQLLYRYQGEGNLNYYQLFTELSLSLLKPYGRLGFVIPASIYSDLGAIELRRFFLEKTCWEWLFSFENKLGIFPGVHRSFKFCTVILTKGGMTENIQTAFMRYYLADWESSSQSNQNTVLISREAIRRWSPIYNIILEIPSSKDAKILFKIYDNTIFLKDAGLKYVREFDMTNHSKYFPPAPKWIDKNYKASQYGYWEDENGNRALPLYEGRMIGQFDFSKKGWISGKGRTAKWEKIPFNRKRIQPQYLMAVETFKKEKKHAARVKIAFIHVSSSTNTRSMICSLNNDFPHGNSAPFCIVEKTNDVLISSLFYTAFFNSFCFDYALRIRLTGTNLTWFTLEECPVLDPSKLNRNIVEKIAELTAKLNFTSEIYSGEWLYLKEKFSLERNVWQSYWAISHYERTRIRAIIDALIAYLLGLTYEEFSWVIRDDPANPKGFWRVDQKKPEELRSTYLSLLAFQKLENVGIEQFCEEEWDYPSKIRSKYSFKLVDWQHDRDAEESWKDCEKHAKIILGEREVERMKNEINKGLDPFVSEN